MIELTLIIPAILIILGGVVEIGLLYRDEVKLLSAVQEGARYASNMPELYLSKNQVTVRNYIRPLLPSKSRITIGAPVARYSIVSKDGKICSNTVTVSASFDHQMKALFLFRLGAKTISHSATARYNIQPLCR
jgi:Flp pilus assembly protein TadG